MQLVFPWREYISTFCFLVGINWYVEVPWLGEEGQRSWLLRPGGNLLDATVHLSTFFSFAKPYSIVIQFWLLCTLFGYGCLYSGPSTEFAHSRMFVSRSLSRCSRASPLLRILLLSSSLNVIISVFRFLHRLLFLLLCSFSS